MIYKQSFSRLRKGSRLTTPEDGEWTKNRVGPGRKGIWQETGERGLKCAGGGWVMGFKARKENHCWQITCPAEPHGSLKMNAIWGHLPSELLEYAWVMLDFVFCKQEGLKAFWFD